MKTMINSHTNRMIHRVIKWVLQVLLIEIIISLDRADILGILVDISIVDMDHVDMN